MHLATPQSAILSAVIFNALIIIALIPLALRGIKYRAVGASRLLRDHLLIYGLGGIVVPFVGHQGHRPHPRRPAPGLNGGSPCSPSFAPPSSRSSRSPSHGLAYPLLVTGIAQAAFPARPTGASS